MPQLSSNGTVYNICLFSVVDRLLCQEVVVQIGQIVTVREVSVRHIALVVGMTV
jgi:hypothetical protein